MKDKHIEMKQILLLLIVVLLRISPLTGQDLNMAYDSVMAKKLGADEYGMKTYVLVILKTGKKDIQDKARRDSLFAGHFANIYRLAEEGRLIVAGPFNKNINSYRGLFILNVTTFKEANELLQADPTIKEGIFDTEMYNWYGSAALPVYLDTHKKLEKYKLQ